MKDSLKLLPDFILKNDPFINAEDLFILVQKLAIAIFIGVLIGLEREHSREEDEKTFAGIRTFPLISTFGFLSALISSVTSFWIFLGALITFGSLVTASHVFSAKTGRHGGTSEVSALIVFILGALTFWNFLILAAIVGVITALFLSLKLPLHKFAGKISNEDIYATIKLTILTVIILPLLPNKTYGPFNVLNPHLIWRMVIFISSISFIGYILIKFIGQNKGTQITGLIGGLVSSTAVTYSLSKKSKQAEEISGNFAIGIILASTVMYPRIFFIILVLNISLIPAIWFPLFLFTTAGLGASYFLSKKINNEKVNHIDFKNPFEIKSALLFGLIFGLVIFVTKAAQHYLGSSGIYAASALAGLTSVDAIVISISDFFSGGLESKVGVAAIIIASISNSIVKGLISSFFGTKQLSKTVWTGMAVILFFFIVYFVLLFTI